MEKKAITFAIALSTLAFTLPAQAHDPSEHTKDAESPNCAAIKNMDHSKMDMKDPVVQAIMKQCMKDGHHDENAESDGNEHREHDGHAGSEEGTGHRH
jgi:hypothetical protein